MRKVGVYIAFVLSTAWLLFGSWQLPQTLSGNHASYEASNDYWQHAPRASMTDEGKPRQRSLVRKANSSAKKSNHSQRRPTFTGARGSQISSISRCGPALSMKRDHGNLGRSDNLPVG